jgi:hypothetical protein
MGDQAGAEGGRAASLVEPKGRLGPQVFCHRAAIIREPARSWEASCWWPGRPLLWLNTWAPCRSVRSRRSSPGLGAASAPSPNYALIPASRRRASSQGNSPSRAAITPGRFSAVRWLTSWRTR